MKKKLNLIAFRDENRVPNSTFNSWQKQALFEVIGFVLGSALLWIGFCYFLALLAFLGRGYPSAESLALRYFKAVRQGNVEGAANLADSGCRRLVREYAREDIAQFSGSKVRDVKVRASHGTGSDETYWSVLIRFEYRHPKQSTWQSGKICIGTTKGENLFFRHLTCGG